MTLAMIKSSALELLRTHYGLVGLQMDETGKVTDKEGKKVAQVRLDTLEADGHSVKADVLVSLPLPVLNLEIVL